MLQSVSPVLGRKAWNRLNLLKDHCCVMVAERTIRKQLDSQFFKSTAILCKPLKLSPVSAL